MIDRGRSDMWPLVEKVQIRYLRNRCVRKKDFAVTFKKLNKHYQSLDLKAKFMFLLSWTQVLFNRRYCRAQVHYLGYCLISFDRAVDGPLYDGFEDLKTLLKRSLDEVLQFSRLLMNSLEMNCKVGDEESRAAAEGNGRTIFKADFRFSSPHPVMSVDRSVRPSVRVLLLRHFLASATFMKLRPCLFLLIFSLSSAAPAQPRAKWG